MLNSFYELSKDFSESFYVNLDRNGNCPPHFHRNFELLYVTHGKIKAMINDKIQIAEADDIIFVHHYYRHETVELEPANKICIVAPLSYCKEFDGLLKDKTLPSVLTDKKANRSVKPLFLEALKNKQKQLDGEVLKLLQTSITISIYAKLITAYSREAIYDLGGAKLVFEILFYIDKNFSRPLDLTTLSDRFGYNKFYFSKLWNKQVNLSLNAYINSVRTQKVTEYAHEHSYANISDIVFDCGFNSLTTFYRYFNQMYGGNPKTLLKVKKTE